jgi:uncharacterized protein
MEIGGVDIERHDHGEPRVPTAHLVRAIAPRVWTIFAAFVVLALAGMLTATLAAATFAFIVTGGNVLDLQREATAIAERPMFLLVSSASMTLWSALIAAMSTWGIEGSARARLRLGAPRAPTYVYALVALAVLAVSQVAASAIHLAGVDDVGAMSHMSRVVAGMPLADYLASLVIFGVAAPIGEELFFRGFVQTRLSARWGATAGVVVTAFLFGLLHADPVQSVAAFAIGVVLGWAVELTGSIRPAIVAHVVNNLVWVGSVKLEEGELASSAHLILAAVCVAVATACVVLSRRSAAATGTSRTATGS